MERFRGVFTVTLTPFHADESVDEDCVRAHVNWLVEQGVHGIIPTGSTGEAASLSVEERKRVVEITIDEVRHRVPVLVGSGANTTRDTIMYSRHAEEAGADGVMVIHPYYCMPNERELYEHYKLLSQSIHIPIMIYNNPVTSGIDMKPELLARLAEFENIAYFKEASGDIRRVNQIKRLCGDRFTVFVGCDHVMFECLIMGAEGWVAGSSNIVPKQCIQLYELTVEGEIDKARELYYRMLPLGEMLETEGLFIQCLKAGAAMLGRPLGKPRRPLLPPEEKDLNRLKAVLDLL